MPGAVLSTLCKLSHLILKEYYDVTMLIIIPIPPNKESEAKCLNAFDHCC